MAKKIREPETIKNSYISNFRDFLDSENIKSLSSHASSYEDKYRIINLTRVATNNLGSLEDECLKLKKSFYTSACNFPVIQYNGNRITATKGRTV